MPERSRSPRRRGNSFITPQPRYRMNSSVQRSIGSNPFVMSREEVSSSRRSHRRQIGSQSLRSDSNGDSLVQWTSEERRHFSSVNRISIQDSVRISEVFPSNHSSPMSLCSSYYSPPRDRRRVTDEDYFGPITPSEGPQPSPSLSLPDYESDDDGDSNSLVPVIGTQRFDNAGNRVAQMRAVPHHEYEIQIEIVPRLVFCEVSYVLEGVNQTNVSVRMMPVTYQMTVHINDAYHNGIGMIYPSHYQSNSEEVYIH